MAGWKRGVLVAAALVVGCAASRRADRAADGGGVDAATAGDGGVDAATADDGGVDAATVEVPTGVCGDEAAATGFDWVVLVNENVDTPTGSFLEAVAYGPDGVRVASHRFFAELDAPVVRPVGATSRGAPAEYVPVAAGSGRPVCGGDGCLLEVAVFGPDGVRAVWRAETLTDPGHRDDRRIRWNLRDGRFVLVDLQDLTTSLLVDAISGETRRLDAAIDWLSDEADADGWHGALQIERGGEGDVLRPAFARPADGAVVDAAGAPTSRSRGAGLDAWDPTGRWLFVEATGDGGRRLVAAGPTGVDRWPLPPVDAPADARMNVVVDGGHAVVGPGPDPRSARPRLAVPLAVVDLGSGDARAVPRDAVAALSADQAITVVRGGFALTSVGGLPVLRLDLRAGEAEALTVDALGVPDAAPFPISRWAFLATEGRVAIALERPEVGLWLQPSRDAALARVGRPAWGVGSFGAVEVGGTWWLEQWPAFAPWPGEPPEDAVVGEAWRSLRGAREVVRTGADDERLIVAYPTSHGRCAYDAWTRVDGPPNRASLVDLVTGEEVALPDGAGSPIVLGP